MVGRAIVYGLSLAYMFLGVSIISDRFMSAIEVITSQEKQIHVRDSNGNKQVVMVRIWNETVSNLTVSNIFFFGFFVELDNFYFRAMLNSVFENLFDKKVDFSIIRMISLFA